MGTPTVPPRSGEAHLLPQASATGSPAPHALDAQRMRRDDKGQRDWREERPGRHEAKAGTGTRSRFPGHGRAFMFVETGNQIEPVRPGPGSLFFHPQSELISTMRGECQGLPGVEASSVSFLWGLLSQEAAKTSLSCTDTIVLRTGRYLTTG